MTDTRLAAALHCLRQAVVPPAQRGLTDAQLLGRFAAGRAEADFAAILERHGRLVWGVCRHVLGHEQDAEDAFQATFLVLARDADSVRNQGSLASWLQGVARRVALKVRERGALRRMRESSPRLLRQAVPGPAAESALHELQALLDEEVRRLPEKLRAPFVLCCLEGRSKAEAARELGWKEGTVSGRLAQARERLRCRLARRGVSLTAGLTAAALVQGTASAAVPAGLARAAVEGAVRGNVGPAVAALAKEVARTMVVNKLRLLVVLVAVVAVAAGMGWAASGKPAPEDPQPKAQGEPDPRAARPGNEARVDALGDPLPPGAVARFGTQRFRHSDLVTAVAYAPDGKLIASAGQDRVIRLWHPATGKEAARLPGHKDFVYGLAFSPDGKTLASAGRDATVLLWDVEKVGRPEAQPRKLDGFKGPVLTVAFAPDGATLATGGDDGAIVLWDAATGKETKRFGEKRGRIRRLAFSPDGKVLAAAHLTGDFSKQVGALHLWDPASGEHVRQVGADQKTIYSLAFAPDGKALASGEDDGPKVWDAATGKPLAKLRGAPTLYTPCVLFSPDGKELIVGGAGLLRTWSVTTGEPGRTYDVGALFVYSAAFSPDGKTLVTGGTRSVTLWDPATARPVHTYSGHGAEVDVLLFSPDGKELLTAGYDRPIYRWDIASGKEIGRLNGPTTWNSTLALSPDGKTLAALGPNLSVLLLDAANGRERVKFTAHLPPRISGITPMAVVFSPDGKTVVSSTQGIDSTIRVWDADTGKERRKIGVDGGAATLALAPDGKTLYSAGWQGPVRVWDLETGKETRQLVTPGRAIARLALSADGRRLASGAGGTAFVWDTATGRELCQLTGHKGNTMRLAFAPDGHTLAVAGDDDDVVRFWEVASGRVRLTLGGHTGAIKGLGYSADGRLFATGGSDTTALVWDVASLPLRGEAVMEELPLKQVDALWKDLAGADAEAALRAVARLTRAPDQAAAALGERLQKVQRVHGLIAQLEDDEFAVREEAAKELERLGPDAEPALREAAAGAAAEARTRARAILERLEKKGVAAPQKQGAEVSQRLQALRALEVLEAIGTTEARRVLAEVAKGYRDAELTREAKAALARLRTKE
jgi:RNA polymerase sigma factor (sigma-70 family)